MLEDIVGSATEGLGLGVGILAAAAVVVVGGGLIKPLAKGAIKGYLAATSHMGEAVAGAGESIQDIYAEAKHEYEQSRTRAEASAGQESTQGVRIPIEPSGETAQ